MAEDRGNSYAHTMGVSPDDYDNHTVLLNAGQLNQLKCSHTTTII